MRFKTKCPNCYHEGRYDIDDLVEVNESWCLDCVTCGNRLITCTSEERKQVIQGIRLTEKYVPDVINASHTLKIDKLPSRINFGRIASKGIEK